MDRDIFKQRFVAAYEKAREFGQTFVIEELPEKVLFNLNLNSSYDKNASADLKLFPEDSNLRTAIGTKGIAEDAVLGNLYRDGLIPLWVNLQLAGITNEATIIRIESCGRFSAKEDYLYHKNEGWPPFHVLGPTHPYGYEKGDRFSIFTRSEFWTVKELEYLVRAGAEPWQLQLCGPEFSDDLAEELLELGTVEILELRATGFSAKPLSSISFMPKLRVLRISRYCQPEFDFSYLPKNVSSLTSFSFQGLPSTVKGGSLLREVFPKINELTLSSSQAVDWDQPPVLTNLKNLRIYFPNFASWVGSIEGTESVSLEFNSCTSEQVFDLLNTGRSSLKRVILRGTPIDDGVFDVLAEMPRLEHFDVVDTKVDRKALKRFTAERPDLSCWPNLK